jgi:Flp pilus assembly protein TadB
MSAFTAIVAAVALAFVVISLAWGGPGVVLALPVALVAVGIAVLMDFRRRRKQAAGLHDHRERARTEKVDFSERDQQTLVSE